MDVGSTECTKGSDDGYSADTAYPPKCWAPKGAPVAERKRKSAEGKIHLDSKDTRLANTSQLTDEETYAICPKVATIVERVTQTIHNLETTIS